MSSQMHGKRFEDFLKTCFYGSSDHGRSPHEMWDIESCFDKHNNLPTNIKTSSGDLVCLADARKIWSINEPFRLLVGNYTQTKEYKIFNKLYEMLISSQELNFIRGSITIDDVNFIHNKIKCFGPGKQNQFLYQDWYKNFKNENNIDSKSIIKLNPKVDSKNQRRLQCSVSLKSLLSIIKNYSIFEEGVLFRDTEINLKIKSCKRNI